MAQHDVLRLNVAMVNAVLVQVGHCFQDLTDNKGRGFFRKAASTFEFLVELPIATKFRQKVHAVGAIEEAVQGNDVGVPRETADLNFAGELLAHVLAEHLLLLDAFQRSQKAGFDVAHHEHSTGLPFAQLPDEFEVFGLELLWPPVARVERGCPLNGGIHIR